MIKAQVICIYRIFIIVNDKIFYVYFVYIERIIKKLLYREIIENISYDMTYYINE